MFFEVYRNLWNLKNTEAGEEKQKSVTVYWLAGEQ